MFVLQDISHQRYVLTDESKSYVEAGSPEAQLFNAVPAEGITLTALKVGQAA
jgi:phenylalanyl-tRNA synthetase alpha chain